MKNYKNDYIPGQGIIPLFLEDCIDLCDRVVVFDNIMKEMHIEQYLKVETAETGRPRYNPVDMLKTILFGFMDGGYASLRELEDRCKSNLRYKYLMKYEVPSYRTFGYFIEDYLEDGIEEIFQAVNKRLFEKEGVDLEHVYIDGSKFEANANKYTFVWRKGTEKARYKLYEKITVLLEEMNAELTAYGLRIATNTEYVPEYLADALKQYEETLKIDLSGFVRGRGRHKTQEQRNCEKLAYYIKKLNEYKEKLEVCGPARSGYSKTDHDATFMRVKKDYMGNDQLLPAYNVQIAVADEYIAAVDVQQFRSDMDCFIPLMNKFCSYYGKYPKYPVADAGYGSFNNYIFCQEHGMEKYMKFSMFEKETKNKEYRNDIFRPVNFPIDEDGNLRCPNGKKMVFSYRQNVRGSQYGRQEEVYECEDCTGCPYASQCRKGSGNRTIRLNAELTSIHEEVINNLESIHGAYLRMNRSIQAEGTFGVMKYDRWYKRTVRRSMKSVRLELFLVSIGHNLYKYYNKHTKLEKKAA